MAFLTVPKPSDDDEIQKIVVRTDYNTMSEQELELAYEDACQDACGYDPHDFSYMDPIPEKFHILFSEDFLDLTDHEQEKLFAEKAQWDAEQKQIKKQPSPRPLSVQRLMTNGLKRLTKMNKIGGTVLSVVTNHRTQQSPRRTRQRGAQTRSSASSGDGNSDNSDGEPPRLLDQAALASILSISKKTLQNQYSVAPHTLPPAIAIPGARGPRWTPQAVQEWLEQRPKHTPKPVPVAPKRKVGRPRLALAIKGVQS